MLKDPVVQEIRKIRREIEEKYKDRPREFFKHLQQYQQQFKGRLVHRHPKPHFRAKTA